MIISSSVLAKPHMVAEVGDIGCLASGRAPIRLQADAGVKVSGANREEQKMVSQFIKTLHEETNEQQTERMLSGLTIVFKDHLRSHSSGGCLPAHQLVRNTIHIGRYCKTKAGKNVRIPLRKGLLVHEVGHFIANKLGTYASYNRAVSRNCKLTNYMVQNRSGRKHKNRNEEFAEAFAAYLTHSRALKRKCRKAFNFLKEELFLGNNPSCL
jgi:hypothetical protein